VARERTHNLERRRAWEKGNTEAQERPAAQAHERAKEAPERAAQTQRGMWRRGQANTTIGPGADAMLIQLFIYFSIQMCAPSVRRAVVLDLKLPPSNPEVCMSCQTLQPATAAPYVQVAATQKIRST